MPTRSRTESSIYIDESGHLPNDLCQVAVFGSIRCRTRSSGEEISRINAAKSKGGLPPKALISWNKVSPANVASYRRVIEHLVDSPRLDIRIIAIEKTKLSGLWDEEFEHWCRNANQKLLEGTLLLDHTLWPTRVKMRKNWRGKMVPLDRFEQSIGRSQYRASSTLYANLQDTRGAFQLDRLNQTVQAIAQEHDGEDVQRVQLIRAKDAPLMQCVDVLIGAIGAALRRSTTSSAKNELISLVEEKAGQSLSDREPFRESPDGVFRWRNN